jgi:PAS domain S-box-containing protein
MTRYRTLVRVRARRGRTRPGFVSHAIDRTPAEAALRRSEAHLARAQRVAAVGSAEVDFRTGKWEWSDETYRIYGLEKGRCTPSYELLLSIVHEEDRATFKAVLDAAWHGVTPPPTEYRIVRPDGEIRILYRVCELIHDAAGNVVGVIGTKKDITELRAAERQREEMREQLVRARRMEALGTLAGGIAHDLNNALVPVLAIAELVASHLREDDGEAHEGLGLVIEGGRRAKELVQQILAFSRGDEESKNFVRLDEVIRESLRLLRASIPATIWIDADIQEVPPILGNASQLHQLTINLATNAAQAIGDGMGIIRIETAPSDDGMLREPEAESAGQTVRLSIADSGAGIRKEDLPRIFDPFFTTKPVGEGTGLGLAIVHSIVQNHGGRIFASSTIGVGTRFDIYFFAAASKRKSILTLDGTEK